MKKLLFFISFFLMVLQGAVAQDTNQEERTVSLQTLKVKVFPNPATNVVNILGLQNSNGAKIQVTDTYGNIVLSHHWSIRNNALNIPITSLESGIYIVTIHSEEQRVQTKFYKQ